MNTIYCNVVMTTSPYKVVTGKLLLRLTNHQSKHFCACDLLILNLNAKFEPKIILKDICFKHFISGFNFKIC